MRGFSLKKGDSKLLFVLSCINAALYTVWSVAYIVCAFLRDSAFNNAQSSMMLSGQATYTVEVTSPFFGVLKVFAFALPVLISVWTAVLLVTDRKNKALCDNKLIICAFGAAAAAALLCALDVAVINMIF